MRENLSGSYSSRWGIPRLFRAAGTLLCRPVWKLQHPEGYLTSLHVSWISTMLTMRSVSLHGKNYVNDCGHLTSVTQGLAVESLTTEKRLTVLSSLQLQSWGIIYIWAQGQAQRSAQRDRSSCDLWDNQPPISPSHWPDITPAVGTDNYDFYLQC